MRDLWVRYRLALLAGLSLGFLLRIALGFSRSWMANTADACFLIAFALVIWHARRC